MKKISLAIFVMANTITVPLDYQDDLYFESLNLKSEIKFSSDGIQDFLKNIFNNNLYAQKVLPTDFSHFRQFIDFGVKTKQGKDYLKQVLRIFRQKFMSCEYVCARESAKTIKYMSSVLHKFSLESETTLKNMAIGSIKNLCYDEFSQKFEDFKNNPEDFLNKLSEKIYDAVNCNECEKEANTALIKTLVLRFLETLISKILWSPQEGTETWQEFILVGSALQDMHRSEIITDQDDLNDLVKLLVERFTYFLSLAGADLPEEFFEQARRDLMNKKLEWLEIEELESELTTKFEYLRQALIKAQIKSKAQNQYGIISD